MSILDQKTPPGKGVVVQTPGISEAEIWRGFLATKPTLLQMACVAKEKTLKPSYRQLALRKLYAIGTKQSLILLISVAENDAECLGPAIEGFFAILTQQLKREYKDIPEAERITEDDLLQIAEKCENRLCLMIDFVKKHGLKNQRLLRILLDMARSRRSKKFDDLARVVFVLTANEREDVLNFVCLSAEGATRQRAIQECLKDATAASLKAAISAASLGEKNAIAAILLEKFPQSQTAFFVLKNNVSPEIARKAWDIFCTDNPHDTQMGAICRDCYDATVRNLAWQNIKARPRKAALREVIFKGSPLCAEAIPLLWSCQDYDEADSLCIIRACPERAEEARNKLKTSPAYFLRKMRISS